MTEGYWLEQTNKYTANEMTSFFEDGWKIQFFMCQSCNLFCNHINIAANNIFTFQCTTLLQKCILFTKASLGEPHWTFLKWKIITLLNNGTIGQLVNFRQCMLSANN